MTFSLTQEKILPIFCQIHPVLPLDVHKLLAPPRRKPKRQVGFGKRALYGRQMYSACGGFCCQLDIFKLMLSLSDGSSQQLGRTLGQLVYLLPPTFTVDLCCSTKHPLNFAEQFGDLISELKAPLAHLICLYRKLQTVRLTLASFIAGGLAKFMVNQIKHHIGRYTCERCAGCGHRFGSHVIVCSFNAKIKQLRLFHVDERDIPQEICLMTIWQRAWRRVNPGTKSACFICGLPGGCWSYGSYMEGRGVSFSLQKMGSTIDQSYHLLKCITRQLPGKW